MDQPNKLFPMTPAQRDCLRATFRKILPLSDAFGVQFYDHLFRINPPLRELFPVRLADQGSKLMHALSMMVEAAEHPQRLQNVFAPMGERHLRYGVCAEHYDDVGAALLLTLRRRLGNEFTAEAEAAWTAAYGEMVDAMLSHQVAKMPVCATSARQEFHQPVG